MLSALALTVPAAGLALLISGDSWVALAVIGLIVAALLCAGGDDG